MIKDRRELTYDERATWGECPVCHVPDGEWCIGGTEAQKGVHLGRIQKAPFYVLITPVYQPDYSA
jgi:uncharacterized protein (DUF779 family)